MFKVHRTYELTTGIKGPTISVIADGEIIYVLYHDTIVFKKTKKRIEIDNGGFDTVSTRHVINRALSLVNAKCFLERRKGVTWLTYPYDEKTFEFTRYSRFTL